MKPNKLREEMSQRFLESLNEGQIPWYACWQEDRPRNALNDKPYRGVNAIYLSYVAREKGYADPRWCTYRQAQEQGWQVRKGEKSALIEYWAYFDTKAKKMLSWSEVRKLYQEDREYFDKYLQLRSRCYNVFNAQQMDGIPERTTHGTDIGALRAQRDTLVQNMGYTYREEPGSGAFYRESTDTVTLPPEETFVDTYGYMATFLHESAHASGHESRLNRDLSGSFGSEAYAREELRAEIASAFTAQAIGLRLTSEQLEYQTRQHCAYVQSWSAALKDAPEELYRAIRAAEQISDYLLEQGGFQQLQPRQEPVQAEPVQEPQQPPYQVTTYHSTENGFDDKRDYQTLQSAQAAAQGYVDGSMESDGFRYEGAAIYSRTEKKYIQRFGDFPLPQENSPRNTESFYAKILRPDFTGEAIPVFYDDLQRCRAALSAGMPGMYVPLTEEQFLKELSGALLTQGHYNPFGDHLLHDYTQQLQRFMELTPPQVSVHPWMAAQNEKVNAVHAWEQRHLPDDPSGWTVRPDGHTGQLLIQPGQEKLLDERYEICRTEVQQERSYGQEGESWEPDYEP